jgi:hypothetical protein
MNKQPLSLVGALGLGAGLMYLLDSQQGARRRAVVRDKAVHTLHSGGVLRRAAIDEEETVGRGFQVCIRSLPQTLGHLSLPRRR